MKDRSDVNRFNFGVRASDTVLVFVHGGASDKLDAWQNTEALDFWGGRLLQKAFFVRSPLTDHTLHWSGVARRPLPAGMLREQAASLVS